MSPYALQRTGVPYAQREDLRLASWMDRKVTRLWNRCRGRYLSLPWVQQIFCNRVLSHDASLRTLDTPALTLRLQSLARDLRFKGPTDDTVAAVFAAVREMSFRVLGVRHFDSQIKGAYAMVQGCIAEMDTGEGKTLTATLVVACMAYAGNQVHMLTVNDYLAQRDRDELDPLYRALGLSTSLVLETSDLASRQSAYGADIVYCTGKTVTFDYLRDRISLGSRMHPLRMALDRLVNPQSRQGLLRGLHFALVDEADSVLIDEARTPLIISEQQPNPAMEAFYRTAVELARGLEIDVDFLVQSGQQRCAYTQNGLDHLARLAPVGGLWRARAQREEIVLRALDCLHCFRLDVDYIIRDEKILIVDANTGRVMPDRSWERGLQQLMEIKHALPVSPEKATRGRISFQMFFRRYLQCAGMTGTCREVAGELAEVYGLPVVRIRPRLPSRRRMQPPRLFLTADQKWQAVALEVLEMQRAGRPVLVGTRSVSSSERMAETLLGMGIAHEVINAKHDSEEAALVSRAGQSDAVTIATNMAGRGTDIKLPQAVEEGGGLHVILTEYYDNVRVDRQLIGRCARQGNRGSARAVLSLQDDLAQQLPALVLRFLARHAEQGEFKGGWRWLGLGLYRWQQRQVDAGHGRLRQRVWIEDYRVRQQLSFTGTSE